MMVEAGSSGHQVYNRNPNTVLSLWAFLSAQTFFSDLDVFSCYGHTTCIYTCEDCHHRNYHGITSNGEVLLHCAVVEQTVLNGMWMH